MSSFQFYKQAGYYRVLCFPTSTTQCSFVCLRQWADSSVETSHNILQSEVLRSSLEVEECIMHWSNVLGIYIRLLMEKLKSNAALHCSNCTSTVCLHFWHMKGSFHSSSICSTEQHGNWIFFFSCISQIGKVKCMEIGESTYCRNVMLKTWFFFSKFWNCNRKKNNSCTSFLLP